MAFLSERIAGEWKRSVAWALPARIAAPAFFALLWAVSFARIVTLLHGHFTYTLDDSYIELALAERLVQGFYGINFGEFSAPSSSIAWPFILIPGAGTAWHQYLPLVLNFAFGAATAWLVGFMVDAWSWPRRDGWHALKPAALACLILVATNAVGLALTGMEHSLQLLLAIIAAYAVLEAWRGKAVPAWCLWAVALSPLVRYEDFVLVAALAATLIGQNRIKHAAGFFAASLVLPSLFGVFLMWHGLPLLPTSVFVKTGGYGHEYGIVGNLLAIAGKLPALLQRQREAWPVAALVVAFAATLPLTRARGRAWIVLGCLAACAVHLCFGRYGWFYRYEAYIVGFGLLVILGFENRLATRWWPVTVLLLLYVAQPYVRGLIDIPGAARNIHEHQFQMHRFVHDYYKKSFAVNDLGWVSFQLDPHVEVLDLGGLASYEAARQEHKDWNWLDLITRRERVGLVMIYPDWFEGIPADWTPLAKLHLGSPLVVAGGDPLVIYATPNGDHAEILAELRDFARDLPAGERIELADDPQRGLRP